MTSSIHPEGSIVTTKTSLLLVLKAIVILLAIPGVPMLAMFLYFFFKG